MLASCTSMSRFWCKHAANEQASGSAKHLPSTTKREQTPRRRDQHRHWCKTETLIKTTMLKGVKGGNAPAPGAADGRAVGEELSPRAHAYCWELDGGEQPSATYRDPSRTVQDKNELLQVHKAPAEQKHRFRQARATREPLPTSLVDPNPGTPTLQSGCRGRKHLPTLFWCCISYSGCPSHYIRSGCRHFHPSFYLEAPFP